MTKDSIRTCTIDGCEKPILARSLCGTHYAAWHRQHFAKTCSIDECHRPSQSKGYCNTHYQRLWKVGDVGLVRKPGKAAEDATSHFWRYVRKTDGCWFWEGPTTEDGYGILRVGKERLLAHRFSYELHIGPVPEGLLVRHRCHTPPCVNPADLLPGTFKDNSADMVLAGRSVRGTLHRSAKLTDEMIRAIRAEYARAGTMHKDLAARYGVATPTITNAINGKTWGHVR